LLNRKIADRGVEEEAERRRGTWSKVQRVKEDREESGRARFQDLLTKARSNLARMGGGLVVRPGKKTIE